LRYYNAKKIAQYYDERAKKAVDIVSAAGQWFPKEYTNQMCDEICKKIKLTKSDKILEIGSGSDVLGNYVRKRCKFYAGADISSFMLKKCLEQDSSKEKPNVIQSTTHEIPFQDELFTITIMNSVSMYLLDEGILEKTLFEMERVTIPGGTIFIGENITPERTFWEYTWFQRLNPFFQIFAKPYIRFRIWLAKKNIKLGGKWKNYHKEITLEYLKNFFDDRGDVVISDAACYTIRKRFLGEKHIGNHRVDFIIKLKS